MDQASFSLDFLPPAESTCPHCGKSEHSVSHGYLYKQVSIEHRKVVGKRILCSRRNGKGGCGRTRQWYLADIVPRRRYPLSTFVAFIYSLLGGDTVEQAYLKAIGSIVEPRHAWRWLHSFLKQLPRWRIDLSPIAETFKAKQRSPLLKILLPTLKALSTGLGHLNQFQMQFQRTFC